jgi:hypothetical protein
MTNTRELVPLVAGQFNKTWRYKKKSDLKKKERENSIFPAILSFPFLFAKGKNYIFTFRATCWKRDVKLMAIVCRHAEQRARTELPGEAPLERMNRL